ncbi:MAG: hypothetical protein PHQ81_11580 [Methanofollis sp.]|nr:hypothetical protein [Methanofollis sp.]
MRNDWIIFGTCLLIMAVFFFDFHAQIWAGIAGVIGFVSVIVGAHAEEKK